MQYAKIVNETLVYPSSTEFNGVPGWTSHDPLLRSKGYLPVHGYPDYQRGSIVVIDSFEVEASVSTHTEPRQVVVDGHQEMQDTPVAVDDSYIQITGWHYEDETPVAQEPEPDTTLRDDAERAIVGAIVALAQKYDAVPDLVAMEDITIPNLQALAVAKGVPDAEFGALIVQLTPYKWQLEAITGTTWAECWEGLKERFGEIMQGILEGAVAE